MIKCCGGKEAEGLRQSDEDKKSNMDTTGGFAVYEDGACPEVVVCRRGSEAGGGGEGERNVETRFSCIIGPKVRRRIQ